MFPFYIKDYHSVWNVGTLHPHHIREGQRSIQTSCKAEKEKDAYDLKTAKGKKGEAVTKYKFKML
jgi:hypothetical protein